MEETMFYLMVSAWIFSEPQPAYPYPMLNDLSWELHEKVVEIAWKRYLRFWGENLRRKGGKPSYEG
jgi:hypothetical protein